MGYWDYAVQMPDKPGEMGKLAMMLGEAGINIEGAVTVAVGGEGWMHLCVGDTHRAETGKVIEDAGYKFTETEVLVETVDDRPGVLGRYGKVFGENGININFGYLLTNNRLCIGTTDVAKARQVWMTVGAQTH
jgi:hypothetical protein